MDGGQRVTVPYHTDGMATDRGAQYGRRTANHRSDSDTAGRRGTIGPLNPFLLVVALVLVVTMFWARMDP